MTAPNDGTAIPAVHGDAASPAGVPVLPCPPEAPGPASRAPERDAADSPPSAETARSGGQAAPRPGLRGKAFADEVRRALAEQARRQRGDLGRRIRAAQRTAAPVYRAGGNRRGGRT